MWCDLYKPWLLGILGNRELQQDQQAPVDRKTVFMLWFMSDEKSLCCCVIKRKNILKEKSIGWIECKIGTMIHTGGPAGPGKPSFPRAPWRVKRQNSQVHQSQWRDHSIIIWYMIILDWRRCKTVTHCSSSSSSTSPLARQTTWTL